MTDLVLLDAPGCRRSPATMPGFHCGRPPRNRGLRYPADPPAIEEIVAVMRVAGDTVHGTRALIVVLWRAGLRISEAWRSPRVTSTAPAAAFLSVAARAASDAKVGMDGGHGSSSIHGCASEYRCRSARCCASSTARHKDGRGHRPPSARHCAPTPSARVRVADSLRANYDTRTRSRWPAKVCRSTSSNGNSVTRTSASRPATYKESTTARSSKRWELKRRELERRRRCPRALACASGRRAK